MTKKVTLEQRQALYEAFYLMTSYHWEKVADVLERLSAELLDGGVRYSERKAKQCVAAALRDVGIAEEVSAEIATFFALHPFDVDAIYLYNVFALVHMRMLYYRSLFRRSCGVPKEVKRIKAMMREVSDYLRFCVVAYVHPWWVYKVLEKVLDNFIEFSATW
jgi:hypothetical protein